MAEDAELGPSLRRLLKWITKKYKIEKEIAKEHLGFNPPSIEMFMVLSSAMRRRIFKEGKNPTFDELISKLVDSGYVHRFTGYHDPNHPEIRLSKESTFYCLTKKGEEAKIIVVRKR